MRVILIRHYGYPFKSSMECVLLATGAIHHIVLMKV